MPLVPPRVHSIRGRAYDVTPSCVCMGHAAEPCDNQDRLVFSRTARRATVVNATPGPFTTSNKTECTFNPIPCG